ncbi:MAG: DMT family transporter [Alphaproteobacteria bacterium]
MNNKSTKLWLPYFILLSMAWGSTFLFIEVCLEFLTPIGVAFARFSLGALFMLAYITKLKLKFPREKKILLHLFVLSLILNSIFGILLATAQTGVTSVLAGLGASIVPIMTIFFVAVIFQSEPLTFEQLIGLFVGFFGALIIVGVWNGIGENPWWAMLALLGCTMCYGISYPYTKKYILPHNLRPEVMATTQLCFSMATLLPLFIFFGVKSSPSTIYQVGAVLGVGFVCSGIAYVWNFRIQEAVGSLISSTTMYVIPIVATILGITLLGESLTWNEPIGCVIVLLGAAISQGRIKLRR